MPEGLSNSEIPRYVYHGTGSDAVEDILSEGLKPRTATGRSNWDQNDMESLENHVYLSRLYGGYFGVNATENNKPFALFEIDLERLHSEQLYPDEDFVEQMFRTDLIETDIDNPYTGDIKERTRKVREDIELYKHLWDASLQHLGNISYKGSIPPTAIRRVSIVDPDSTLTMLLLDAHITIRNAMFTGEKYEVLTSLLMGDDVSLSDIMAGVYRVPIEDAQQEAFEEVFGDSQMIDQAEALLELDCYEVKENPNYMR